MPVVVPASNPVSPDTRDATSFDGRIRAIDNPAYGGVRLKIDYSIDISSWSTPFQCTVYRKNQDGTVYTVRGGDPYLNYAAKGWLYDSEAPLGQSVSYYVIPVSSDGTANVQSASASIVTTAPAGTFKDPDMWLVNLEDPSTSIQVRSTGSLGGSYNGRNDKQAVLGNAFPVVTPDTRTGLVTTLATLTVGEDEFTAMQALLKQNIVMRKSSTWERPDGYFVVDDVSYASQAAHIGPGIYSWQLNLVETSRPNTFGQTVMSPVYTLGNYQKQYPLFSDVPSKLPFDAVQGGNLLDGYTSDAETGGDGLNGWDNLGSNTTIVRTSNQSFTGTYSRKIAAISAGTFGAITSLFYPVITTTTHTFTVWLYSANGLTVDLGVDWANGAGTVVASDALSEWGQTLTLTPNIWTRATLKSVPASGSSQVKPWLRLTASASNQFAYFDTVTLENV